MLQTLNECMRQITSKEEYESFLKRLTENQPPPIEQTANSVAQTAVVIPAAVGDEYTFRLSGEPYCQTRILPSSVLKHSSNVCAETAYTDGIRSSAVEALTKDIHGYSKI